MSLLRISSDSSKGDYDNIVHWAFTDEAGNVYEFTPYNNTIRIVIRHGDGKTETAIVPVSANEFVIEPR